MIPTTEIPGLVPFKHNHSWIENFDVGGFFCTICGISVSKNFSKDSSHYQNGYWEGYYEAITEISNKSVGFDRDKLAKLIYNLAWPFSIWENQMELVKERYYKRVDAIIAHEKDVMVCKQTERK